MRVGEPEQRTRLVRIIRAKESHARIRVLDVHPETWPEGDPDRWMAENGRAGEEYEVTFTTIVLTRCVRADQIRPAG